MKYLLLIILIITITGNAMSGPQYRKKLGIQSFTKNKSTTEKEFYKAFYVEFYLIFTMSSIKKSVGKSI